MMTNRPTLLLKSTLCRRTCPFVGRPANEQVTSPSAARVDDQKSIPRTQRKADLMRNRRLGGGARTRRNALVPASQMAAVFRDREIDPRGEVDRHERQDVGDRVALAGDELAPRQVAVQHLEEPRGAGAAALGERRDLLVIVRARQSAADEAGRGVAEGGGEGPRALPLDAVMPAILARASPRSMRGSVSCRWCSLSALASSSHYSL